MPSGRLISSSEKNRQRMSSAICDRTSRIHTDVWYAHGHIGSKKNSIRRPAPGHHRIDGSPRVASGVMQRPSRFEHTRFLGDKRTQLVYDLDTWDDATVIDDIVESETGLCFGPDTLVEARNRGYTLARPGRHRRHRKPRA